MNSRRQGQMGEMEASRYLRQKGYDILAANYRTRLGEIEYRCPGSENGSFSLRLRPVRRAR